MSKDGTPLAAVGIKYADKKDSPIPLMVRRPKGHAADFQCLFQEGEQEFKFVLINFTNSVIKIDIGRKNVAVDEVDPGASKGYVNRVNELHGHQSTEILGDQKDSKAFVLHALTTSSGEKISVEDAEVTQKGTYYYIAVIPCVRHGHLDLFKDTFWTCPEFILVVQPKLIPKGNNRLPLGEVTSFHSDSDEEGCVCELASISYDTSASLGYATRVGSGQHVSTDGGYTGIDYVYDGISSNQTGQLCCLSLSIAPTLERRPVLTDSEIVAMAIDYQSELDSGTIKRLKVYPESHCVICLDDEPDTIIYKCGHQCVHRTCINVPDISRCPLCRQYITGMLTV
jgi:hypothetical protein